MTFSIELTVGSTKFQTQVQDLRLLSQPEYIIINYIIVVVILKSKYNNNNKINLKILINNKQQYFKLIVLKL